MNTMNASNVENSGNLENAEHAENAENSENLNQNFLNHMPGARLALLREKNGYSIEYVASKLHLRVSVIAHLEKDAYEAMPEPVFIKGYLRAYANLLGVDSNPLIARFHEVYQEEESSTERTLLWQNRKQTNPTERWMRLGTALFAGVVIAAAFGWWVKNKEVETLFTKHVRGTDVSQVSTGQVDTGQVDTGTEIKLTDLSDMRSLLSAQSGLDGLELSGD